MFWKTRSMFQFDSSILICLFSQFGGFPPSLPGLKGGKFAFSRRDTESELQSIPAPPISLARRRFAAARSIVGTGHGCPDCSPRLRMCVASVFVCNELTALKKETLWREADLSSRRRCGNRASRQTFRCEFSYRSLPTRLPGTKFL
jgi:hypothetical protein